MATLLGQGGALLGLGGPTGAPSGKMLEMAFSLDDPAFQGDHFRMYDFKVKRCPRARPHDWTACPFAHPGEKAKRRDPRRYRYSGTACPDFRKTGVCRRGDACPYSHGVFECWLHPSRYRTQMCTDGPSCRRRVCFFAHYEHELRRAEEYPPLLNQQLHAGLVADARALQQQQLAQALSGILGGSVPSMPAGGPASLEPLMSVQLLKTLSQGTPAALLDSTPATPTGIAGLSPTSAAAGGPSQLADSSKLLLQLQLLQQQAAGGPGAAAALHATFSDASQQSSSPGGSPRMMGGTEVLTPIGVADAARQGSTSPVMVAAEEANQLARIIQQQQQQQQQQAQAQMQAAQQAAAAAGGIDPALLAALQSMGLGSGGMPEVRLEGLDVSALAAGMGLSRRSIDNNALGSMARHHLSSAAGAPAPGNTDFLAAAAAALAGGGGLGGGGMQVPTSQPPSMLNHNIGGSLPTQSFMAAAAALARSSGQPSSPQARLDEDRTLSLDQILDELPRSASQVHMPNH